MQFFELINKEYLNSQTPSINTSKRQVHEGDVILYSKTKFTEIVQCGLIGSELERLLRRASISRHSVTGKKSFNFSLHFKDNDMLKTRHRFHCKVCFVLGYNTPLN